MPLISGLLAVVPATPCGHRTRSTPSCDDEDVDKGGGVVPCSKADTIAAHEQPKRDSSPPLFDWPGGQQAETARGWGGRGKYVRERAELHCFFLRPNLPVPMYLLPSKWGV